MMTLCVSVCVCVIHCTRIQRYTNHETTRMDTERDRPYLLYLTLYKTYTPGEVVVLGFSWVPV